MVKFGGQSLIRNLFAIEIMRLLSVSFDTLSKLITLVPVKALAQFTTNAVK